MNGSVTLTVLDADLSAGLDKVVDMADLVQTRPADSAVRRPLTQVKRVRKAYEQVYDQLRGMILRGELGRGEKLPIEAELGAQFGVGRSTVREALRLLHSEDLIKTYKGVHGGSFVNLPTAAHISSFLERSFDLLSLKDDVTLPEFLEARELIEVFAVRQIAIRCTDEDITALRATIVPEDSGLDANQQYLRNKEFHSVLITACGNTLLRIAAEPIFYVMHTHLDRAKLALEFPRRVCADHLKMLAAIEVGDADTAEVLMRTHLDGLAVVYADIWHTPTD